MILGNHLWLRSPQGQERWPARAQHFFDLGSNIDNQAAKEAAAESIMWYTHKAFEYVGSVLAWSEELGGGKTLATYEYMKKMMGVDLNTISYDHMADANMVLSGNPETCLRQARNYQQAGTEMLLCHLQTYKVTHQQVIDSIRLIGQHVIPYFK